jgi:hypothetical protein
MQAVRRPLFLLLLALAAGCGGGDDKAAEPTTTAPTTSSVLTVTQPEDTARPGEEPTGEPTFTVTLTGESRTPTAGQAWSYTVLAKSKQNGAAAPGTAKMRVYVDGELVDTLGFFGFVGELVRTHVWPKSLSGKAVEFQAEVEGDGGTQRVVLPLTVR